MCKSHGGTWNGTEIQRINGRLYNIDKCIAQIVKALNMSGLKTVASCCGHGKRPGSIALGDGREIIIVSDYKDGRKIDECFPSMKGVHRTERRRDMTYDELVAYVKKEFADAPEVIATLDMEEHPEDYGGTCFCALCMSYD